MVFIVLFSPSCYNTVKWGSHLICLSLYFVELLFLNYLVEDKAALGLSYVEYLVQTHRQIQNRMTWAVGLLRWDIWFFFSDSVGHVWHLPHNCFLILIYELQHPGGNLCCLLGLSLRSLTIIFVLRMGCIFFSPRFCSVGSEICWAPYLLLKFKSYECYHLTIVS